MPESPLAPHSASPGELAERMQAERGGKPFLVYRDGSGKQEIYALDDTTSRKITIGRDWTNDIPLVWDSEVSAVHAELERIGERWIVVDDGLSRNGTYVNGERVGARRRLRDGDTLRMGETVVVYRSPIAARSETTIASDFAPLSLMLSEAQRRVLIAHCRPYKDARTFATPPTNQQMAEELFLSVDAVKTHLRTLFHKFGVEKLPQNQKRAALVEQAFQSGLISERDL
jgi:hypothetical protein